MTNSKNASIFSKASSFLSGLRVKKILRVLGSLKITVVCLVLLAILTVWGTVYQAEYGLYMAQQKFFHSWVFSIFGLIPFPGTVTVMFVLFVNLVCTIIFRIGFRLKNVGNLITHLGIIVLLVGGFLTFYYSQESTMSLKEGQSASMSSANQFWELALWRDAPGTQTVFAVDADHLHPGDRITFAELNIAVLVKEYYRNCSAFTGGMHTGEEKVVNSAGIVSLKEKPPATGSGDNTAGGVWQVTSAAGTGPMVLLYGKDPSATVIKVGNQRVGFSLRRRHYVLPVTLTLKDFRVKFYPNSRIPKSYESTVSLLAEGGMKRDVVISMNKPLRYKDYTFFQSSYYTAEDGSEYSILAVVKNSGRLLPYFSSGIIFLGMIIHFLSMFFRRTKGRGIN